MDHASINSQVNSYREGALPAVENLLFAASERGVVARSIRIQIIALLLLAAATSGISNLWQQHDFNLYWNTSENLRHGQWPYIAFDFEYPPLAAFIFAIPRILGVFWRHDESSYAAAFSLQAAILASVATIPVAALARKSQINIVTVLRRYTVVSLLMFTVMLSRYDIVPALATVIAILCLINKRPWSAGSLLGFAIAAKLYPLVLLGIFLGYCVSRREFRDAARVLVATIAIATLPFLPYLLRGNTQFLSFLRYHEQRGLQLESLPAGIILLAGKLGLTTLSIKYDFGAYHVHSPASAIFLAAIPWVMASACVAMTLIAYRRMRQDVVESQKRSLQSTAPIGITSSSPMLSAPTSNTLVEACVAMLLIFMAANKVFSPQYFVWILPLAPLLRRRVFSMLLLILALTAMQYPLLYWRLREADLDAVLLLNLRNALVVAAIAMIAKGQFKAGLELMAH